MGCCCDIIGFAVRLLNQLKQPVFTVMEKVTTVKCYQTDSYCPSPPGPVSRTDVLCFDNSYSILQSKKVSYKVEILPPPEDQVQQGVPSRGEVRLQ